MIFSCISDNVSSTVKSVIYFVQQVARYDLWFPCSVHLDARQNQPQHEIKCGDFLVHFRQRNHPPSRALFISNVACNLLHDRTTQGTLFNPFPAFPISCNKLHATMHDQITHGTLFNPFGHFRFRASRCTLRSTTNPRTERYLILSDISDFYDPRPTHARNVI